jgi:hypothetical protein
MGQFFLQIAATLIGALLAFLVGLYALRWHRKRETAVALLAEFQSFDVERIHAILEKHLPRRGRARRRFEQEAPAYSCTFSELNSDLNDEERRTLMPFIQFFERLVLLYESNSVDKRALWSVLGRQITWWQEQFFWVVEPNDENNAYGIASQVAQITAAQAMQEDPWYSLMPKVRLISAKPKDGAVP